ncbi:CLUMA_CG003743, isoform A [Clunio marinus]|uniref:CLUMA_CG003743, isoform A n=1 Tax=Clunio marinus TaxID=568069 RepID=A0A1J1HR50_9DIPT|nr:CLUMA_CG003743, isoform A [Clunio marinus]
MSINSSKTPVTILQEYCAKTNPREPPIYTELSLRPEEYEDQPNLTFFIKCIALGREAIGGGINKNMAKHSAAEKLLNNECVDVEYESVSIPPCVGSNIVTDLHDYCAQRNYHKPEFRCVSTYGASHAPTFIFECKLNSIVKQAEAKSKKMAKQLSAKLVLDELLKSYPDMEKKLTVVNDSDQADKNIRQKVTSYLQLKKENKADKMGTTIKDRHAFFRNLPEKDFVDALINILSSGELNESEKYDKLLEELKTMWNYSIEPFIDTEFLQFELAIDYEKFTCVIIGSEETLPQEVLSYFKQMLNIP